MLLSFTINMANDVANSMDRMKLTSKDKEIIAISDEGWLEAIESCHLSLIGKFLMCKSFNKLAILSQLPIFYR